MANEVPLVMAGNLTADPELRYTISGVPVVNLSIAQTPRTFDRASGEWKDGEAVFMRGTVWRDQAEHVAASLVKGQRVVAIGSLVQKSFQDREGNNRTSYEFEIDEIAPSLRYGTTKFTKSPPRQQGAAAAPQMAPQAAPAAPAPGVNPPQYQQPVQQQYQQPAQAPAQYQQPVQQAAPVQQQAPVQYQQPAQVPAQAPVPVGSNVSDDEF